MGLYERVSGARMHAAYFRVGGVAQDLPPGFLNELYFFICQFRFRLCEIIELLNENRIWRQRLVGVGMISAKDAKQFGFTGVMLRSTGIASDLRKLTPYEIYDQIPFQTPVGRFGDCFDRYVLRMEEMFQSLNIIEFCINKIPTGNIKNDDYKVSPPSRVDFKTGMEALIHHFKYFSVGVVPGKGGIYVGIESPKGEFGVDLTGNDSSRPYRCKIRSPGFYHLQGVGAMAYNHFLADATTILGTQDVVFGEIDR